MSEPKWTLQDAKNKFSAVVDAALKGEPQHISRRGQPAVVVVSAEEFEAMRRGKTASKPSFKEMLLAIPKGNIEFERAELEGRDVEF